MEGMQGQEISDVIIPGSFIDAVLWCFLVVGGFIILTVLLMFLWAWLLPDPPPRVSPQFTEADRAYVTERMKFHGITRAYLDGKTGERYFERDGRRCRL